MKKKIKKPQTLGFSLVCVSPDFFPWDPWSSDLPYLCDLLDLLRILSPVSHWIPLYRLLDLLPHSLQKLQLFPVTSTL